MTRTWRLIWTRQKVVLGNSDPVGHNVKIDCRDNPQSNDTIPSGGTIEKKFDKAERLPVPVSCSIHPWMKGWIVIRDTPYMAVTDADGKFEIKNLPAGEWQFMFWQEQAGYVSNVKSTGNRRSGSGVSRRSRSSRVSRTWGTLSWARSLQDEKAVWPEWDSCRLACQVAADCDGIDGVR